MSRLSVLMSLATAILMAACAKPPAEEPGPEPFTPEKYEEVKFSFSIEGVEEPFSYVSPLCQSYNVGQGIDYGGAPGFYYTNRFNYEPWPVGDLSEIALTYRLYGIEQQTSSRVEIPTILHLHNNYPERSFATFFFEYKGHRYFMKLFSSVLPLPVVSHRDHHSESSLEFLEDFWILKCFENHPVLPAHFKYDGYVYTQGGQDSLKVNNFEAYFPLLMVY